MSDPIQGLVAGVLPKFLPDDAAPFRAVNSTDITVATKQTIKSGVSGKCIYVTEAACYNKTTTQNQILMLRHGTTDVAILHPEDIADAHGDKGGLRFFDPPIKIPVGLDLDGIGILSVGDCVIECGGYVGSDNGRSAS